MRAGGGPDEARGRRSERVAALEERAGGGAGERASASLIRRTLPPVETAVGTYRRIPPTAVSTGGKIRPTTAHGGTSLPPVHPAVTTFRRMNRRLGDIFEKKYHNI